MSQKSSRGKRGRNRRSAPKPTGFQKFIKTITFGLVDLTPKRPSRKSGKKGGEKTGAKRSVEPASVPDTSRLYVGNLNYDTTDSDLEKTFGKFGDLKSAAVVTHGGSGRSKGFGFVEFENLEAAKEAVSKLHGTDLQGRTIIVNGAKSEKPKRDDDGGRKDRRTRKNDEESRERRGGGRNDRGSRSGGRARTGNSEDSHKKVKPLEIEQVSSPSLRVSSLNSDATDQDIDDLFAAIGAIQGRSETGAADSDTREYLIDLASTEDAQKAVELLDGKSFMGHRIKVTGAGD